MSKHWKPDRKRWLSAEDYKALSPAQRRALYIARAEAKRRQRTRFGAGAQQFDDRGVVVPFPASRQGWELASHLASFSLTLIGAVLAGLAFAAFRSGSIELPDLWSLAAQPSVSVTADFGFCHAGGGTNCVVDGDTFYLNGDKVRIAGIDAPETHDYGCALELALGEQATAKLHGLLNSGAVTMTRIDRDRDTYGRLLRNVAVNGQDVGEALISAGVAREYAGGRRPWC